VSAVKSGRGGSGGSGGETPRVPGLATATATTNLVARRRPPSTVARRFGDRGLEVGGGARVRSVSARCRSAGRVVGEAFAGRKNRGAAAGGRATEHYAHRWPNTLTAEAAANTPRSTQPCRHAGESRAGHGFCGTRHRQQAAAGGQVRENVQKSDKIQKVGVARRKAGRHETAARVLAGQDNEATRTAPT